MLFKEKYSCTFCCSTKQQKCRSFAFQREIFLHFLLFYKTTKVQEYFSLKSKTPLALNSNVVYKFTCSLDVNVTYIGTSARHLSIRAGEHLNVSRSSKSAIKEHIKKCSSCKTQPNNMGQFKIIRKCQTSYEAKIHEALVIKRSNRVLNKQLYANGASILLNVF